MPKNFGKLRRKLLKQRPFCRYCLRPVNITDSSLDHVRPKKIGGKDYNGNLVLTCMKCNNYKGDLPMKVWARMVRWIRRNNFYSLTKEERRVVYNCLVRGGEIPQLIVERAMFVDLIYCRPS